MRIGDATFYLRFLAGLQENRARSEQALRSLADGKKVRSASDDPAGTQEALALRTRLVRLTGFDRSAELARTSLATIDSVLGDVLDVLSEAQTEAMAGASAPADNANEIRAAQVEALRDQLLRLANTSQGGRYLFGGTETRTAPFATDGTYSGNTDEVQAPIDSAEQVGATIPGSRVFVDGVDLFAVMTDLADALRDNRTADVGALVPVLNQALDHVGQIRGDIGFRMRRIDQVLERHGDEELSLLERISAIEDADIAEIAVQLQASETATSALSAAAVRVLGRSLFDYLG
jgi:flagellar hook-associated protein 3 FlgL